jgi:hypothetical protein
MRFTLKSFILFTFQVLLILVPLTWTSTTSELFEFPKILITYAATIVIVGLWLVRMIQEHRVIFRRTPLELPILLFLGSQLISTLTSINIHTSLFGYYSRFNGGMFSLLCYVLLYFATVSNYEKEDAHVIVKTFIYSAIISSIYAFPEHFGHSPSCLIITGKFNATCWVQDVQNRVFGTFGQPNWLAAYLISLIFIPFAAITSWSLQKKKVHIPFTDIAQLLLFFLVLVFTKSRSGLLGLIVGLICFGIGLFISRTTSKQKVLKSVGIITTGMLLTFLLFGRNVSGTTDKIINRIFPAKPTSAPTATTTTPQSPANSMEINITPSSDIRRIVWKGAWDLALKHPFFGTGVETFAYSYYNVRPVEHNLVSEWNFLYNKAHNEFLNYAATTGFVGLGTYLLFLMSYIVWGYITTLKQKDETNKQLQLALIAGFIALCVSNFFGFSTVPVNTILFLFPALTFIFSLPTEPSTVATLKTNQKHSFNQQLLLGTITIICLLLILAVNTGYRADLAYATGKAAHDARQYQTAITKLQDAIRMVPDEPLYSDELAQTAADVAVNLAANHQLSQASEAASIAVELANRTMNLNRYHINFYKSRTKIFITLAQMDSRFAIEAAATLDAAIRLAPTDAKLWYNRAILAKELGHADEAYKTFQKTIELKANDENARYQFGLLLTDLKKYPEAEQQYQYILDRLNPGNQQVQVALAGLATRSAQLKK